MVAYGYLQTKHIHRIWKEAVHRTAWLVCLANPSLKFIYFASYFLVFCVIYLFLTVFRNKSFMFYYCTSNLISNQSFNTAEGTR